MTEPTALLGSWVMSRVIDDRRAGERLTLDGTTELTLDGDGRVRWNEAGLLHRGDSDVPVSRALFIEPRDDEWFVTFDDGRDFHPWTPGEQVVHPCAADTYVGRVVVESADRWTIEWRVSGPAKDYTMRSLLTRAARPDDHA